MMMNNVIMFKEARGRGWEPEVDLSGYRDCDRLAGTNPTEGEEVNYSSVRGGRITLFGWAAHWSQRVSKAAPRGPLIIDQQGRGPRKGDWCQVGKTWWPGESGG